MGRRYTDLTGKRFGRLLVLEFAYKNKHGKYVWKCLCDCGNICYVIASRLMTGRTLSCGCLQRERASEASSIDLVGRRFERLVVIRKYEIRNGYVIWECRCDCGKLVYVRTADLINGSVKSCGCYKADKSIERGYDLVGRVFGRLTVIRLYASGKEGRIWECRCECGNVVYVRTADLMKGHTQSCGCIQSHAEIRIRDFLNKNNIRYQTQKCFVSCRNIASLRFDFYLPNYNVAIEYDGEFHYKQTTLGNDLEYQQHNDQMKTKYCEENDIVLIRIPYWEKDNIESILSDWLFLNTEVDDDEGLSEAAG